MSSPPSGITGISCTVAGGALQLILPDGACWTVPRDLIDRSPVLVDTLASTECSGCEKLLAPDGYLESWLGHVRQEYTTRRNASNGSLAKYFQAADYFADETALQELCRLIGSRLFDEPSPETEAERAEKDITDNKILARLPSHLLVSVIRSSSASLGTKLRTLPEPLHPLAVLAAFPAVTTERTVDMDAKRHSTTTLAAALRALSVHTAVKRLHISNLHLDEDADPKEEVLEALVACISAMAALQTLTITTWTHSHAAVHAVCAAVCAHPSLHTLDISHCEIDCKHAKPIAVALGHLPHLRSLTLRQDNVTSRWNSAAELTPVVSTLPLLTHLDLGNNPLCPEDTATLSCSLLALTALRHLNLCACYMKHDGALVLAPALATLTTLTLLKVASNMLLCVGIQALAPALASLQGLRHLDLRRNGICVTGVRALACVLPGLTKLQQLYIGSNAISSAGAKVLAPVLPHLGTLEYLDVSCNRVRDEGIVEIASALHSLTRLQHLNVGGDAFGRAAITGALAPGLAHLLRLQFLDLELASSCPLKECAQSLAAALCATRDLRTLRLSLGALTNGPATTLAAPLAALKALQCLDVTYTTVTELGAEGLGRSISCLLNLRTLILRQSNSLGGAADRTALLAPAIAKLSNLQHLCMAGVHMSVEGAAALAQSLFNLGNLECLLLSSNRICDDGMKSLAPAISCLHELHRLELTECGISDAGAAQLAQALSVLTQVEWVELNNNSIEDPGAFALVRALQAQEYVERLDMRCNDIEDTDAAALQQPWILNDSYHIY